MDFSLNARISPADYLGVDMTPVRELKRAEEATKVRAKHQSDPGTIARGQSSLEQEAAALERAGRKLEVAGRTVHQVEDLLHDTLTGFRSNLAEQRPPSASQRLLQSADETANDIVGYARFDEEQIFPPSSSPLKLEEKKAMSAYASQKAAFKEVRDEKDPPEVSHVLRQTGERIRGEGGVLPTLGSLAESGHESPEATDRSLVGLRSLMRDSLGDILTARKEVDAKKSRPDEGGRLDVAS